MIQAGRGTLSCRRSLKLFSSILLMNSLSLFPSSCHLWFSTQNGLPKVTKKLAWLEPWHLHLSTPLSGILCRWPLAHPSNTFFLWLPEHTEVWFSSYPSGHSYLISFACSSLSPQPHNVTESLVYRSLFFSFSVIPLVISPV